ncbi:uncharacterized protein PHACADRAFT_130363 [Phanerochaete carnosa HHB-10118-sp]|uniref:J domain-containing protein n=1 Tax=Phanerochaete carnosa (strain HHB-10118-sp) TaxID=650164 RepID=K5VFK5_PHACS|nr:uncharacterized protein PHACADRAFT_130363 [Phanerochaete carnosa HHB-10118-sp]EKM49938.1 hypothetical protein PHACADRAFT_130363 [Phanerochaete carnosa HHB-10118-sp]
MASNLYEILSVNKTATPEEIRKAYKKKALATHPDRLPQGVSEEEKQKANEQFRLVNNAYEVLTNAEHRKRYDQHGVWPPPTVADDRPTAGPSHTREPFSGFARDPFSGHGHPMHGFAFSDPFELFNTLFGDVHRAFANDPFLNDFSMPRSPFEPMFSPPPLCPHHDGFFGGPLLMFGGPGFCPGHPLTEVVGGGMGNVGSNGQWVSQSKMTRMMNGRTETITKRRDALGNEHVTHSSPEGERYTINGIEQPPQSDRHLPPSQQPPSVSPPSPPPPAVNYSTYPNTSTHSYTSSQHIPVNYANHQPQAPSYSMPTREPSRQYTHAPPVSRHSSYSSHHHASRVRDGGDDSMRRSSSGRHHSERERAEPAYADPINYYDRDAPRRSTSSQHSHHDKYGTNAGGYPSGYASSAGNGYTNAYIEPARSSHSHHSSRHRDSRDEHHKHRRSHGW